MFRVSAAFIIHDNNVFGAGTRARIMVAGVIWAQHPAWRRSIGGGVVNGGAVCAFSTCILSSGRPSRQSDSGGLLVLAAVTMYELNIDILCRKRFCSCSGRLYLW